jgi:hypothetical protein
MFRPAGQEARALCPVSRLRDRVCIYNFAVAGRAFVLVPRLYGKSYGKQYPSINALYSGVPRFMRPLRVPSMANARLSSLKGGVFSGGDSFQSSLKRSFDMFLV